MHQQIRRWVRNALWIAPLFGLGIWLVWLPIWPAAGGEGGFAALCSSAAALLRVAQSVAAPAVAPAAASRVVTRPELIVNIATVPGMMPVANPANLYSAAGANMLSPAVAGALHRVYVPNLRSNNVYVIDPATEKVIDHLPGRHHPAARRPVLGPANPMGRQ